MGFLWFIVSCVWCFVSNMTETVEDKGKVFLKNIPNGTERDEICQLFSSIGPLKSVILPNKAKTANFPTIYGFVSFQDEKDATKAISQFNNFLFCNTKGGKSELHVEKAFKKVPKSGLNKQSSSSLWSVGSLDSDKGSASSDTGSTVSEKVKEQEPEWMKERKALMEIIAQNDQKITELQKKRGDEHLDLDKRERELLEELERLPKKIHTLKEEIEVLKLQVKLKELEKEQDQILTSK